MKNLVDRLTDEQIEQGRKEIFSTGNPYCPCSSKTMQVAVRWAERKLAAPAIAPDVQRNAERYRFLRDHFATKSENSVDDFITLEPMTGEYFDAHIDILMSEFYADKKGTA
mgnify:FL=1